MAARGPGPLFRAAVAGEEERAERAGRRHGKLPGRSAPDWRKRPDGRIGRTHQLGLPPRSVSKLGILPGDHLREGRLDSAHAAKAAGEGTFSEGPGRIAPSM